MTEFTRITEETPLPEDGFLYVLAAPLGHCVAKFCHGCDCFHAMDDGDSDIDLETVTHFAPIPRRKASMS